MTDAAYRQVIAASPGDRLDLFLTTANRLGTPVGNVEKDFWVCWTLNALYHERPAGGPRLLFKGGTSLSKAYGLIERFSEDIDVTVFRDDLNEAASVEELEALSNKKRRARLDAIRDACRAYITGPLHELLSARLAEATNGAGRVEIDEADPDGQTLLVWYPEVEPRDGTYVRPAVRIESGAKSALDPNRPTTIRPYVSEEADGLDLTVAGVTTIEATRTFWDKVVDCPWLAPLVRTARCSPAGRPARVATLLRPPLPAWLGGRKSGACRSRSWRRLRAPRAHVLRPPRL